MAGAAHEFDELSVVALRRQDRMALVAAFGGPHENRQEALKEAVACEVAKGRQAIGLDAAEDPECQVIDADFRVLVTSTLADAIF